MRSNKSFDTGQYGAEKLSIICQSSEASLRFFVHVEERNEGRVHVYVCGGRGGGLRGRYLTKTDTTYRDVRKICELLVLLIPY